MALLAMHAIFAFGTCLGFMLPLAFAGSERRSERADDLRRRNSSLYTFGSILDLWLILEDSIPVFWLLHAAADAPEDIKEAKKRWSEEPSIRLFFWITLILFATIPLYFI